METLPKEIENYILWLATGPMNLDIHEKKKKINEEFAFISQTHFLRTNAYLKPLKCYDKTPELEDIAHTSPFSTQWFRR